MSRDYCGVTWRASEIQEAYASELLVHLSTHIPLTLYVFCRDPSIHDARSWGMYCGLRSLVF